MRINEAFGEGKLLRTIERHTRPPAEMPQDSADAYFSTHILWSPDTTHGQTRLGRRKELHDDGAVHAFGWGPDLRHFGERVEGGLIEEETAG